VKCVRLWRDGSNQHNSKLHRWMAAPTENVPGTLADRLGRWGFAGREAPDDVVRQYLRHRIPESMRKRGAANPVRYVL
jgi:hypothetical protein